MTRNNMKQTLGDALYLRLTSYAERKGIDDTHDALVRLVDAGLRAHERAVSAGALGGTTRATRAAAAAAKRSKRAKATA